MFQVSLHSRRDNENCPRNLKYSWTGPPIFNVLSSTLQSQIAMLRRVSPTHLDTGLSKLDRKGRGTAEVTRPQARAPSVREAPVSFPKPAPRPLSNLICSPLSLCSNHTGLFDDPPTYKNGPASGPLHLLFPPPRILFLVSLRPISLYLLKRHLLRKASDYPASNSTPCHSLLFNPVFVFSTMRWINYLFVYEHPAHWNVSFGKVTLSW